MVYGGPIADNPKGPPHMKKTTVDGFTAEYVKDAVWIIKRGTRIEMIELTDRRDIATLKVDDPTRPLKEQPYFTVATAWKKWNNSTRRYDWQVWNDRTSTGDVGRSIADVRAIMRAAMGLYR